MRRISIAVLTALLVAAASAKTLEIIEHAREAVLANVSFSASVPGTVVVSSCASCPAETLISDADTVYIGTSGAVSQEEFLTEVSELRNSASGNLTTAVGIFYQTGTNRVTRISLHPH